MPFDIPDSWMWIKLKDTSFLNGGYAFKSEKFVSEGIRVIRISDKFLRWSNHSISSIAMYNSVTSFRKIPAALKIAPQTPPPKAKELLAALTIKSTLCNPFFKN